MVHSKCITPQLGDRNNLWPGMLWSKQEHWLTKYYTHGKTVKFLNVKEIEPKVKKFEAEAHSVKGIEENIQRDWSMS